MSISTRSTSHSRRLFLSSAFMYGTFLYSHFVYSQPPTAISTASLEYDDLKSLIQKRNIKSIDALLTFLASHGEGPHKGILGNAILMQNSGGLQGPRRVILYNHDYSMKIAYGLDASHSRGRVLEISQKPSASRPSQPAGGITIVFPKNGSGEVAFNDGVSAPKPNCTRCHAAPDGYPTDFKDNFEQYGQWFRAVGVFKESHRGDTLAKYDIEAQYKDSPRGNLVDLGGKHSRNETFTEKVYTDHFKTLAEVYAKHPSAKLFRAALIGALANCPDLSKFFPESWKKGKRSPADLIKQTEQMQSNHFGDESLVLSPIYKAELEAIRPYSLTLGPLVGKIRYVMEEQFGMPLTGWSPSCKKTAFSFNEGFAGASLMEIAKKLQTTPAEKKVIDQHAYPGFLDETTQGIKESKAEDCEALAKESLKALSDVTPPRPFILDWKSSATHSPEE